MRDVNLKQAAQHIEDAMHRMADGRYGIPAPALRSAMISACRLVGFQMTKAKLSVFVEADGFDVEDATPLVLLNGEPEMHQSSVRLESGMGWGLFRIAGETGDENESR